jgi:triphosphoribosyl-dephospho-CoA synthase
MTLRPSLCGQLACTLEVLARKPGNVHRFRDFEDLTLTDFLASAAASAPVLDSAAELGVGATVLKAVGRTRQLTSTNTNLGILLLLAPLAAVPASFTLQAGIEGVLRILTIADSRAAYQAIRLAQPGGLGRADEQDLGQEPSLALRQIMELAADRDLIARQYVNGFQEVLQLGVPALAEGLSRGWPIEEAIILCQLRLLAAHPDSLIARKRGPEEARAASQRAADLLALGWPEGDRSQQALAEFDTWLRAVGHQRNPGTTADLVTASLFAALREGTMKLPLPAGFHSQRVVLT